MKILRQFGDQCPWCAQTLNLTREKNDLFVTCTNCEFEIELDTQDLIEEWKKANRGEISKEDIATNKMFQAILNVYEFAFIGEQYINDLGNCSVVIDVKTFPCKFNMYDESGEGIETETWKTPSELLAHLENHFRLD